MKLPPIDEANLQIRLDLIEYLRTAPLLPDGRPYLTTGAIARHFGSNSYDVRYHLRYLKRYRLVKEIPTAKPNNHGGHIWQWIGPDEKILLTSRQVKK